MVDEGEVLRGLARLGRLQHLHRSGYWTTLAESNVEQSFVERVFAEVFGYATLLASDGTNHDVMPKIYVPLPGSKRAFPDFALGHFRADQHEIVVTAELKSPDADLDAPQGGNYGGNSPVQQAMMAARNANAEWCVISNTNEVRLYRVPDENAYEHVLLLNVLSPSDFRRAHALLSRRSLLGRTRAETSPLSRFHAHVAAGECMLVDPSLDRIRLVQRIRPKLDDAELPFTRLSAALGFALKEVPGMNVLSGEFLRPRLESDRLVTERRGKDGRVWQRIAVVKSGLLVCSYAVPLDDYAGTADQPIHLDPEQIAHLLSEMTAFGWRYFEALKKPSLIYEWSLEDLSPRVRANAKIQWIKPWTPKALKCQPGVERTSFPEVSWPGTGVSRKTVVRILGEVVRELFFPFEGLTEEHQLRCRLEPDDADLEKIFAQYDALKTFP
jgi:hypothetical protein